MESPYTSITNLLSGSGSSTVPFASRPNLEKPIQLDCTKPPKPRSRLRMVIECGPSERPEATQVQVLESEYIVASIGCAPSTSTATGIVFPSLSTKSTHVGFTQNSVPVKFTEKPALPYEKHQ